MCVGKALQLIVTQYQSLRNLCIKQTWQTVPWVSFLGDLKSDHAQSGHPPAGDPKRHLWVTPGPFYRICASGSFHNHSAQCDTPGLVLFRWGWTHLHSHPTGLLSAFYVSVSVLGLSHESVNPTVTLWVIPPLEMIKQVQRGSYL